MDEGANRWQTAFCWLHYLEGSGYHGWQRQRNALTIQEVVETCLARLIGTEVRLHGSGRTDAGVHALGQVAHFRTGSALPLAAFREGLNRLLPRDIVILEAAEAPEDFHARYGAQAKTYEYPPPEPAGALPPAPQALLASVAGPGSGPDAPGLRLSPGGT